MSAFCKDLYDKIIIELYAGFESFNLSCVVFILFVWFDTRIIKVSFLIVWFIYLKLVRYFVCLYFNSLIKNGDGSTTIVAKQPLRLFWWYGLMLFGMLLPMHPIRWECRAFGWIELCWKLLLVLYLHADRLLLLDSFWQAYCTSRSLWSARGQSKWINQSNDQFNSHVIN